MTRRAPHDVIPHVLVAGTAIAVATGFVGMRLVGESGADNRTYTFVVNVVYWLLWTSLAPLVLLLSSRVPLSGEGRLRAFATHLAAGLIFATVHIALLYVSAAAVRSVVSGVPFATAYANLPSPTRMHVEWEITMYWALVGLGHAMMFRAEARDRAMRAAQLEAQLAQAQLQALQRQLQPHFLFNTLQTISALVHRDVLEADRMIERLGDLLRMTLGAGEVLEVPIAREIEHVRHYAAIEQANMGSRLTIAIDIAPDVMGAMVPSLLLQPLVENAVRHGLAPRAAGGRVTIRAWRDGTHVEIRVEDDGLGLAARPRAGVGLENTRLRLERSYLAAQRFDVSPRPGGGTAVTIRVPYRRAAIIPIEAAG
jgi:two-component system LytT family sensor kinase